MKIIDFIDRTELSNKSETEKAKLLCLYHYKENGEQQFSMTQISDLMLQCGFNAPNTSRLKNN